MKFKKTLKHNNYSDKLTRKSLPLPNIMKPSFIKWILKCVKESNKFKQPTKNHSSKPMSVIKSLSLHTRSVLGLNRNLKCSWKQPYKKIKNRILLWSSSRLLLLNWKMSYQLFMKKRNICVRNWTTWSIDIHKNHPR